MIDSYVPEYLKIKNRKLIFDLFLEHKELARSQLAAMTRMSFPTVSKSVDFLLSRGILAEETEPDKGSAGPGRKRRKLVFNSSAYCALAINFEGQIIEIGFIDLSGNVLTYERHECSDFMDPRSQKKLGAMIRNLLATPPSQVLGVCLAFPSNINLLTNEIVSFQSIGGGIDQPIAIESALAPLFSEFSANVYIENDVNLAAKGEMMLRAALEKRCNLCYLTLGSGFGSGIILNGELWAGAGFRAGEIGNMVLHSVDFSQPVEAQIRPLEQSINIAALNARFGVNLVDNADVDDHVKDEMVDFILPVLCPALFNATYLLDIDEYILSGFIPEVLGARLGMNVEARVNEMLRGRGRRIRVSAPTSPYSTLAGAASMVFEKTILDGLQD